ncbi:hypothetical protein [Clostridium beijerinckii]|uniref:hypothetical protein n=1 Tax=Clostridium beijerinckii TaxID=1520 RepID=UPI0003D31A36|nr:hypothetical protein [Clostridium beijerinckii]ALB47301.1 hypothetical protein X276_19645 [Clostridium beijerinckii NRRL B-598]
MKAKYIAENGITIALTLIVLYAASILPVSTLTILTIASCLIPISIIRTSIKNTILVYVASSILSLFLIPTNIAVYYISFFGIYGIVKYFSEKLKNIPLELFFKLIAFNASLLVIYFIFTNLLVDFNIDYPLYMIWIAGQIVLLVYDYALTIIISFYLKRIHNNI